MYNLDFIVEILESIKGKNVTDIHLTAGAVPAMRIDGQLSYMNLKTIYPNDIQNIINEILTEEQKKVLESNHFISSPVVLRNIGRLRANILPKEVLMPSISRFWTS
jgi:twitching motility protein PilT